MLLIRFMGAKELLDHRHNRNTICTTDWSKIAHSSNEGWCFFPLETVSQTANKDEIKEFMLVLGRDVGHTYDYYMIVEGEGNAIRLHHGEYSFGILQEFGCTDFSALRIVKTGICR